MSLEQEITGLNIAINNLSNQLKQLQMNNNTIKEIRYINEPNNLYDSDVLYTVKETSKLLKTNATYVYSLINNGLLPGLKLGQYKIRKTAIEEFLKKFEGKDLTDPTNIKNLEFKKG